MTLTDIDGLAAAVASFHGRADVAHPDALFGTASQVLQIARQNFSQIHPRLESACDRAELEAVAQWTEREHAERLSDLDERHRDGFVRECHGDLHLGNIARIDGQITLFDRLEFNPSMRWIDVMSDVAFLVMDLQDHRRADFAFRALNGYLERTADYGGLNVLRLYLAYRAMVRAKVACFRTDWVEYREYVKLGARYFRRPRPALIVMHGPSGSGKTTVSEALVESLGAIRIRTDIERKRIHGLGAHADSHSLVDQGLYGPNDTRATYLRVAALARSILATGHLAIADGAFLARWQRNLFRDLANEHGVPFVIIDLAADPATLRERITRRLETGRDASEANLAVLNHQLATADPIAPDEGSCAIRCDAVAPLERTCDQVMWRERLASATGLPASEFPAADAGGAS